MEDFNMQEVQNFLKNRKVNHQVKRLIQSNQFFKNEDQNEYFDYLYQLNSVLTNTIALTSHLSADTAKALKKAFDEDIKLYQMPNTRTLMSGFAHHYNLTENFYRDIKRYGYLAIAGSDVFYCSELADQIDYLTNYFTDTENKSFIADVKRYGERIEHREPFLSTTLIENAHIVRSELIEPHFNAFSDDEKRVEIDLYLPSFPVPNMRLEVELKGTQANHEIFYKLDNIKAFGFHDNELNDFVSLINNSHNKIVDEVVEELKKQLFEDLQRYTLTDLNGMELVEIDHKVSDLGYADVAEKKLGLFKNDVLAIELSLSGEVPVERDESLVIDIESSELKVMNPYRLGVTEEEAIELIKSRFGYELDNLKIDNDCMLEKIKENRLNNGFKIYRPK